ncbi:DsbA family oxidoreductase [Mucilaginibacter koreensis]
MKIEIWSDIQCPFCYIGKRRFEQALTEFEHRDEVDIQWKSFQLNPDLVTNTNININEYLAEAKGWTIDYAAQLNQQVTEMAAEVGLEYHMDDAVVANTFTAHQFAHAADENGKGNEAQELLFKAYFHEGKNIADTNVLIDIGEQLNLNTDTLRKDLAENIYADAVRRDMYEAQVLNIRGVPFFVLNDKYAVSGAQPSAVFLQALEKAYAEGLPALQADQEGNACATDGEC